MYPKMLLYVVILSALWSFHLFTEKNGIPLIVFGRDLGDVLTTQRRAIFLTVVSGIVGLVYCLIPALCAISISGSMIFLHALMRDPRQIESSTVFRGSADSDDEGESSGEEVVVNRSDASV